MWISLERTRRPASYLLFFLLLAHLLMLILLLLMGVSVSLTPSAVAQNQIFSYTDISARILSSSPCHGVAPGQTRSWQPLFIVVLMGEPSSTSVHSFAFLRCCLDNTYILQKEDFYATDESIVSYLGQSKKLRYLLSPLIERASNFVPKRFRKFTPILFRATSKFRSLIPQKAAHRLLFRARSILRHSPFDSKSDYVTILEDTEEAADLWLSAAFLTGRLYVSPSSPLAVVDLAGGTLKVAIPVAVETTFNYSSDIREDLLKVEEKNGKKERQKKRSKRVGKIRNGTLHDIKMKLAKEKMRNDEALKTGNLMQENAVKIKIIKSPPYRSKPLSRLVFQSSNEPVYATKIFQSFSNLLTFNEGSDARVDELIESGTPYATQIENEKKAINLTDGGRSLIDRSFLRTKMHKQFAKFDNKRTKNKKYRLDSRYFNNANNKTASKKNITYSDEKLVNSTYFDHLLTKKFFLKVKESGRMQFYTNKKKFTTKRKQDHSNSKFKRKLERKKNKRVFKRSKVNILPKISFTINSSFASLNANFIPQKLLIESSFSTKALMNIHLEPSSIKIGDNLLQNNSKSKLILVANNETKNEDKYLPPRFDHSFRLLAKMENKVTVTSDENLKFKTHHLSTQSQGRNMHRKLERRRMLRLSFPPDENVFELKNEKGEPIQQTEPKLLNINFKMDPEYGIWNETESAATNNSHYSQPKRHESKMNESPSKLNFKKKRKKSKFPDNEIFCVHENNSNILIYRRITEGNGSYLIHPNCAKNLAKALPKPAEVYHRQAKTSKINPLSSRHLAAPSIQSHKSLGEEAHLIASNQLEDFPFKQDAFGNLVSRKPDAFGNLVSGKHDAFGNILSKKSRKRIPKEIKRRRREVEYLRLLSNVTFRCVSGQKFWLFATSIPLGIYPARVSVLLGKQSSASTNRSSFHLTPSTKPPGPAVTSWSRSDIRPEEEYNIHWNGSIYVLPSPPPLPSSSPLPGPSGPGPPLTSTYSYANLTNSSSSLSHFDGVLENYPFSFPPSSFPVSNSSSEMEGFTDIGLWNATQESLNTTDQEIKIMSASSTVDPLWTQDTLEKVKNVVDSVLRAIGTIQNVHRNSSENVTNESAKIPEETKFEQKKKRRKKLEHHRAGNKSKQGSVKKKRKYRKKKLINKSNKLNKIELRRNQIIFNNETEPHRNQPVNKTVILTSNELNTTNYNQTSDVTISSKPKTVVFNLTSNKNQQNINFFPNKVGTISSVTDLLFTVPNLRVINPKVNSQVDSEIKSTEKLVRTSLTDLLYSVPDRSLSNNTREENQNSSDKSIQHLTFPILGIREKSTHLGSTENGEWAVPLTRPIDELIIESSCIPVGSTGRFTINDVSYIVMGANITKRKEKCWEEVTEMVEKYVRVPSVEGMDFLASTAFYFIADSANLIGPTVTYGYVKPQQFREAAEEMCSRPPNRLPDPLACLDYQFVAALLMHGFCLPQDKEIMVSDSIGEFRLSSALGSALHFLQRH